MGRGPKTSAQNLRDEDEAHKLEQAAKAKTTDEELRALIEDAKTAIAEQPEDLNLHRKIFSSYLKLREFDNALEWIAKARKLDAGGADASLERLESSTKLEKMRQAITAQEEALSKDSENTELKDTLQRLRSEERAFRLVQAQEFVKRYPNEFSYRLELGELHYENGETDAAIKELQLAQRSPKVRINSLILLGKAYKAKQFFDLAAEQFQLAKSEITGMTEQKKEVLYELGKLL